MCWYWAHAANNLRELEIRASTREPFFEENEARLREAGGGDWRKLQAPQLEARTKTSEAKDSGTTRALAWALLRPFRNGVFFSVGLPQAVCLLAWALLRPYIFQLQRYSAF